METSFATDAGTAVNEDVVVAGEGFVIVLDGATAEPDTDSGCGHGVRWFATHLASGLAQRLTVDDATNQPLTEILRDAIAETGAAHAGTCDLTNLCSPSSTVALVRHCGTRLDYLVLGDSPIVLGRGDGVAVPIIDDRLAQFDGPWSQLRYARNVDGGFWIAGNNPDAARHALVGTVPVADLTGVALLTDGATRLVERYGWTWRDLLATLVKHGPAEVIAATRAAENDTPPGRFTGKTHDDATAVLCRFTARGAEVDQWAATDEGLWPPHPAEFG